MPQEWYRSVQELLVSGLLSGRVGSNQRQLAVCLLTGRLAVCLLTCWLSPSLATNSNRVSSPMAVACGSRSPWSCVDPPEAAKCFPLKRGPFLRILSQELNCSRAAVAPQGWCLSVQELLVAVLLSGRVGPNQRQLVVCLLTSRLAVCLLTCWLLPSLVLNSCPAVVGNHSRVKGYISAWDYNCA